MTSLIYLLIIHAVPGPYSKFTDTCVPFVFVITLNVAVVLLYIFLIQKLYFTSLILNILNIITL